MKEWEKQLDLRNHLEKFLNFHLGADVHGAGTDLTDGNMDISFTYQDTRYILELKKRGGK